jgi:hypothetical protein
MEQFPVLFRGSDPVALGNSQNMAMHQWSAGIPPLRSAKPFGHGERWFLGGATT